LHIEEVHPFKQLSKYESDPSRDKEIKQVNYKRVMMALDPSPEKGTNGYFFL